MDDKKYYWLQLKRDFFKRHDIRIIESMPNGKDYILFYLKLLCESVDHDGSLRFSEQIPYNEEMLSTITNTNVDIVRNAINVFSQLGMMEILDDGTYFMNEVQKMIGSETYWAQKKREQRAIAQEEELDNVQLLSNSCPTCPSKSKRKSKSKIQSKNNISSAEDEKKKEQNEIGKKVIEYLNERSGKSYRPVESNLKMIRGRLNEGYTYEDFCKVIDNKCTDWLLTDYEKYIQPATLFAPSHFDNYLNQSSSVGGEYFGF